MHPPRRRGHVDRFVVVPQRLGPLREALMRERAPRDQARPLDDASCRKAGGKAGRWERRGGGADGRGTKHVEEKRSRLDAE